jgi:hypothetical protein
MKRKRYTETEMLQAYSEWQKSGLSKKEYCLRAHIGYSTFFNRTKNLQPGDVLDAPGFLRIDHLLKNDAGHPDMEIVYPSGVKIKFYRAVDSQFIKSLI